ncbi:DUF6870 family protein [Lacrimispora sp.]|uniref:DUF6870 family protein n=1 Tax=Lacrimispora sp. TaxID=2719234 RepID=UPI00289B218D|nr:hypothetical protein [Lacrimispora sp.]
MKKRISISELANVDIESVNKEDLVDASSFTFDNTVPQEQRAERVIAAVKNPYCFRVGDVGVKLEFPEDAPPLQDVFSDFLKRKKSGL